MLIKRDKTITKNDLILFGAGSLASLGCLAFTQYPIISCVGGGLVVLGLFKSLKHSMFAQAERNNFISFFRVLNAQIRDLNSSGVIITFVVLEAITAIVDHYLQVSNWFYPMHALTSVPIWLMVHFNKNCKRVKAMQVKANNSFNGELQILDSINDKLTVYSEVHLKDEHKEKLALTCNSHVTNIIQDLYRKNIFVITHSYGKEGKYRKMEKGTIERLEQILLDKKDKPIYIATQENEAELSHEFTSKINPKKMIREMADIEHKLGIKKGYLSITHDNGAYQFRVKKDVDRTYILDDVIARVKKPANMQLPFILGADYSNGSIIFEDLLNVKHLLIAGKTGSGKSCTFKAIIESLMYFNQNISWYMIDFAESALVRYENFNNVKYIESDSSSVLAGINEIIKEYERRKKLFRMNHVENIKEYNNLVPDNKIPFIILAIDEANGFKTEWDKQEFESIEKLVKRILQRGRKYGILDINAVQQTNDNDFVKSWKTQFTRLAHLLEDYIDCQNVTTNKELQQLIPKLGVGEFYLLSDSETKKIKGCLSDKDHDKLYEILKEAYKDVENDIPVIEIDENKENSQPQPETAIEIRDKKADNN